MSEFTRRTKPIKQKNMPKACHYGPMYPKIHPIEMD